MEYLEFHTENKQTKKPERNAINLNYSIMTVSGPVTAEQEGPPNKFEHCF